MRLFLVRHGQTAWNLESRAQGHTDIPLDAVGQQQAELLAKAFRRHKIARVITSDLMRSAETARPVAEAAGAELIARSDLRERSFGEWEGMAFAELRWHKEREAKRLGVSMEAVVPPKGESILMVWERLEAVVTELRAVKESTVVVTHGGTCALLLAKLVRGQVETARAFRFANTGISELRRHADGNQTLQRYNDTSHLADMKVLTGDLEGAHR